MGNPNITNLPDITPALEAFHGGRGPLALRRAAGAKGGTVMLFYSRPVTENEPHGLMLYAYDAYYGQDLSKVDELIGKINPKDGSFLTRYDTTPIASPRADRFNYPWVENRISYGDYIQSLLELKAMHSRGAFPDACEELSERIEVQIGWLRVRLALEDEYNAAQASGEGVV